MTMSKHVGRVTVTRFVYGAEYKKSAQTDMNRKGCQISNLTKGLLFRRLFTIINPLKTKRVSFI
jgi:hypothetical protein